MPEIDLDRRSPVPEGPWTAESLSKTFPLIAWREPVPTSVAGVHGRVLVCRVCVANLGLRSDVMAAILAGRDPGERRPSAPGFVTLEEFAAHMAERHPPMEDLSVPPAGAVPARPPLRKPPGV